MRLRRYQWIRKIASALMVLAAIAFVQQGAATAVSQAAAATGLMPDAAVTLGGEVHYHGDLARHVHAHDGEHTGHTHHPSDPDNVDTPGHPSVSSLGIVSAVIPDAAVCSLVSPRAFSILLPAHAPLTGAEPDGLNRPPSTPSIA